MLYVIVGVAGFLVGWVSAMIRTDNLSQYEEEEDEDYYEDDDGPYDYGSASAR